MAATCVTLWIGERLGPVERACLRSAMRHGHAVHLFCYSEPEGIPEGVTIRSATEIVPEDRVLRHRSGSVALFSNLFRYELQRRGAGTWIDCDVYLLSPLDSTRAYLMGEEAPGVLNTGVLRLPADSPMLAPLIELFEERRVPAWLPWQARLAAFARLLATGRVGLARMPWGTAGPKAFTALAHRHELMGEAQPADVFNPVPWQRAGWIRDPALSLEQVTTKRTVAVHLWNERIKPFKNAPAAPGSFLSRLQAEGA